MEVRDRFDLPITSALAEAVDDYTAGVDLLLSANTGAERRLARATRSHAQREGFEDSLIIAYLRSGQPNKAAPLLRSRLGRRPSARDEVWLELSSDAANGG